MANETNNKVVYDDDKLGQLVADFGNMEITPEQFIEKALETGATFGMISEAIQLCTVVCSVSEIETARKLLNDAAEADSKEKHEW